MTTATPEVLCLYCLMTAGERPKGHPGGHPLGDCGCDALEGRCERHRAMVGTIHSAYYGGDSALVREIYSLSDGYGEPGFVPEQGYDWSGIRDSSIGAVEAMFLVAIGG
jgi:hypothetical protein